MFGKARSWNDVSIYVNLIDIIICPDIRIISKKNLAWSDSASAVR